MSVYTSEPVRLSNRAIQEYAERVGTHHGIYDSLGRADIDNFISRLGGRVDYATDDESLHVRAPGNFTIYARASREARSFCDLTGYITRRSATSLDGLHHPLLTILRGAALLLQQTSARLFLGRWSASHRDAAQTVAAWRVGAVVAACLAATGLLWLACCGWLVSLGLPLLLGGCFGAAVAALASAWRLWVAALRRLGRLWGGLGAIGCAPWPGAAALITRLAAAR